MHLILLLLLASAAGDDPATADAKALYARGKEAFEAGSFSEALADFEGAYSRKALPGFLFNIGLCHRALKNHGKAVDVLERYLRAMPTAQNRAEASRIIEEERAFAAAAAPPPSTAPPTAQPTAPLVAVPPVKPPPPPVPPPLAAPPLVAAPPVVTAPPPASALPAPTPEAAKPAPPTAAPAPEPDAPAEPHGMGTVPVAFIQSAAGLGACLGGCCVASPFACLAAFIPVVGPFVSPIVVALVVGPFIGLAEGWTGDGFGQKRAALVWPIAFAAGSIAIGSFAGAALRGVGPQLQLGSNPTTVSVFTPPVVCGGLTAAVIGPVVLYHLIAVDKQPDDAGSGFPGIFEPADPTGTRGKTPASPSGAPKGAVAMRY